MFAARCMYNCCHELDRFQVRYTSSQLPNLKYDLITTYYDILSVIFSMNIIIVISFKLYNF